MAVTGTFTGTGQSTSILALKADVLLSGNFVATVVIETQDAAGNWCAHTAAAATMTAPDHVAVEGSLAHPYRLNCTAYTSGTVTYAIEGTQERF